MYDFKVTLPEVEAVQEELRRYKPVKIDFEASYYVAAREIAGLRRHIAEIGEAMNTKAMNNPDGIRADTVELLAEELLSVLRS